ncbi:hypothetical protein SDC9_98161 [bioreactor metagenome]|uniref:Uncharacterized protein n=1 Tax=bioreactor metagenome TaxID=1076179 RepID=A0A645AKM9_9ZZZZ
MLVVRSDGFLEQRRIRLGVHVAGQHTLDQARHAVADIGDDRVLRRARQAEFGHHQFGCVGQIGRGIEKGTVEIDDDGFDFEWEIHFW